MPIHFEPSFWADRWARRRDVAGELRCTILAAGLGRRMEPLTTHHLPKPMFPLGGAVPMAELWVRTMVDAGITDVTMNLCVLSRAIERHFRSGTALGADVRYVEEKTPSGTLGAVTKQVLGHRAKRTFDGETTPDLPPFAGSTVIAPSGDIVTDLSAEILEEAYDLHRKAGAAFTMVLVPVPWERRKDFGTVVLDRPESRSSLLSKSGRITEFREKDPESPSNLNNASIYIVERQLLETLDALRTEVRLELDEPFYDFGKHVFPAMLGELPYAELPGDHLLWGLEYDGRWLDVGQKRDYLRVNEKVLDGELEVELPYQKLPWGHLGSEVEIDFDRVEIRPPVVIGHRCTVEPGAVLGPYAVIGDGWSVGAEAEIRRSVLWPRLPFFAADGTEIPEAERRSVDPHRIGPGVTVEESIVTGGGIAEDVREKTVDVLADGEQRVLPIDQVPSGPRA
jgi:NDP-sugar pyrophosphorylase family protein